MSKSLFDKVWDSHVEEGALVTYLTNYQAVVKGGDEESTE